MAKQNRKVILVTGGAQGLGRAICTTLSQENDVVVCDIQEEKATQLVDEIKSRNGSAIYMHLDVSKEDSVQEVVFNVMEKFGRLDVVINMGWM
jgi:NAD(P)-dependent dehydrogenase (short-subunit alcohol dehydrogenase family)